MLEAHALPEKQNLIVVTGAGGFIGGSVVSALRASAANPASSQNRL